MAVILTLGVPGTGPYGQINNLRSYIKDYKEHLRNIQMKVEKATLDDIKFYKEGIKKKKEEIKKIQEELKAKKK